MNNVILKIISECLKEIALMEMVGETTENKYRFLVIHL